MQIPQGSLYVRGVEHSVDPRSFYHAIQSHASTLRSEAITIRDHRLGGNQYTLDSISLHQGQATLDDTQGTFDRLTQAEQAKDPET
ncbi:MAG: hypothetical protein NW220_13025 [Leptolyngbyaceae cyanobacterium bins.349]|nr:hypothetical protein [Leptolyngbyaceae cyanobacterium bins.349]